MDRKIIARFALRESLGLLGLGAMLFWSAGKVSWWPGWALLALTLGWVVGTGGVILRYHPALLAERLGPRRGAQRWDTFLVSAHGLVQIALYVVAGLDQRNGWTARAPLAAQALGGVVTALGYGLVVWATAANAYFSLIVRIQTERGHSVASGGPYGAVRHPAYLGGILTMVGIPLLLGSGWALLLGLGDALLFVLRTTLEDRTLQAELPGYREYAQRVRRRLLPGVW